MLADTVAAVAAAHSATSMGSALGDARSSGIAPSADMPAAARSHVRGRL